MAKDKGSAAAEEQSYEDAFNEFTGDANELREEAQEGQEEELREVEETEEVDDLEDEPVGEEPVEEDPIGSLRNELQQVRQQAEEWQHKYNSDLGRQNALQRKIQEQEQTIQRLQKPQSFPAPGISDKEWKELSEDFPEIAKAVEGKLNTITRNYEAKIRGLESRVAPIQEQAEKSYVSEQYRILAEEHPDYQEIADSQDFKHWVSFQPESVKALISSKQAADAAYLLRTYKNETRLPEPVSNNELKQRREKQLRQAQTVPSRGGRVKSNLPPDDDYEAAFDYFASKR